MLRLVTIVMSTCIISNVTAVVSIYMYIIYNGECCGEYMNNITCIMVTATGTLIWLCLGIFKTTACQVDKSHISMNYLLITIMG